MERISLKPVTKELVYRNEEPNTQFDVLTYEGSGNQERAIGALYLVGHIKYQDEDLGYLVNLISSLARREFYSGESMKMQDCRLAFERTLNKLNEVLDDFFKSKQFNLNLGLIAISGEHIYLSKLGKFKVALARNGEYIDVLNNIMLFNKSFEKEERFSNVISGSLQSGDKLFAYYPARAITLREKGLNPLFVKENQNVFSEKIGALAGSADNFYCCGIHIFMDQIKEIPVSIASYSSPAARIAAKSSDLAGGPGTAGIENSLKIKPVVLDEDSHSRVDTRVEARPKIPALENKQNPQILSRPATVIPSEVSMTRKKRWTDGIVKLWSAFATFGRQSPRRKLTLFGIIALAVLLPLGGFAIFGTNEESVARNTAYETARADFESAKQLVSLSKAREARLAFAEILLEIESQNGSDFRNLEAEITTLLNDMDRLSPIKPSVTPLTGFEAASLEANNFGVFVISPVGIVHKLGGAAPELLVDFAVDLEFLFSEGERLFGLGAGKTLAVYNNNSKQSAKINLKAFVGTTLDVVMFASNVYQLTPTAINKYQSARTGSGARTVWNQDPLPAKPLALAVDGRIYVLSADGFISRYFKGKLESKFDLGVNLNAALLHTTGDIPFVIAADLTAKKVYVVDKTTGLLTKTYSLAELAGQTISVSADDSFIWGFTDTGDLWSLPL